MKVTRHTARVALRSGRRYLATVSKEASRPRAKPPIEKSPIAKPPIAKPPIAKPPRVSKAGYTTPYKDDMRHDVANTFLREPHLTSLVYLEGPEAEATELFLSRGIPASRLVPVNYDGAVARAIRGATGVRAQHADIFDFVQRLKLGPRHVVWLDLEKKTVDPDALARACASAHTVHLTLACRASSAYDIAQYADEALKRAGMSVHKTVRHRSKSLIGNMVHAVGVTRKRGP